MLTLSRPVIIESSLKRLDVEYRSARWIHHRLLDFEDEHQRILDETAENVVPGITRVGRILARLSRRSRRRERTPEGVWAPNPRPELATRLKLRLDEMRQLRNADPRWTQALGWADERIGKVKQVRRRRAKPKEKVKRRKTETVESYRKRFEWLTQDETSEHYAAKVAAAKRQTRREIYRYRLYAERRIYRDTWNALCRAVDQARAAVLKRRKAGLPSEWRRPKYRDPISLASDSGGFQILDRKGIWWTIEMRLGVTDERVRFRAKCGNWHHVPDDAEIRTAKLVRRKDGERWSYSVSLTIDGIEKTLPDKGWADDGIVALDWGHREHGHDRDREGIRAFTWVGSDGRKGELLIPAECRQLLDEIDELKTRLDKAFDARRTAHRLSDRNRYTYRRRLMQAGVRTEEEYVWLRWEMRYERRMMSRRKRITNLRRETYLQAVRELRQNYAQFAVEDEAGWSLRKLQKGSGDEKPMRRRQRANRDLTARYEFVSLCERFGAALITVPSRNTTRECPEPGCDGLLAENGPELLVVCPTCGTVRDKDVGAACVILRRAEEALANAAE